MSEPRRKPGVAFWATAVVVVVLGLYVLSAGPAGRLRFNGVLPSSAMSIYRPLVWLQWHVPTSVRVKWQKCNVSLGDALVGNWGDGRFDWCEFDDDSGDTGAWLPDPKS